MTRAASWGTRLLVALFALSLAANAAVALADLSWWTIPALIGGWYLADLVSGLVHMTMDYRPCPMGHGLADIYFYQGSRESEDYQRMFRARMARLGPIERLVYDFKNHHPRPDALGRRPLWRLIGSSVMLGALPASLLLTTIWLTIGLAGWAMAGGLALVVGGTFAQYFHGTLHRESNPAIVVAMRRAGLLMTPEAHRHHHDTLQRDFSTNCGWSNPLLNRVFEAGRRRGYFRDEGLEPHR